MELIHAINEILGVELTLEYKEERSGDIHDSLADITKIQSIGYQPKYGKVHIGPNIQLGGANGGSCKE
ncbi:hypothetical protein EfmAA610_10040 [Enterococcus faecium]|nr:hypothetical protein EfmAA610_10040 [Enterococcus faecium]